MIEDPKAHFESKYNLAREEISEDSPLLALHFIHKKRQGYLFITKNRSEVQKWKLFKSGDQSIFAAGVGRHLDFITLSNWLKRCIKEFEAIYDAHDLNEIYLIGQITQYLDEIYRNESRAMGIEIIFFTILNGKLNIFRIKPDGDFHPVQNFAIIGGYKKLANSKSSLRKTAIQRLRAVYKKGMPNLKDINSVARKILQLDPNEGSIQFIIIEYSMTK